MPPATWITRSKSLLAFSMKQNPLRSCPLLSTTQTTTSHICNSNSSSSKWWIKLDCPLEVETTKSGNESELFPIEISSTLLAWRSHRWTKMRIIKPPRGRKALQIYSRTWRPTSSSSSERSPSLTTIQWWTRTRESENLRRKTKMRGRLCHPTNQPQSLFKALWSRVLSSETHRSIWVKLSCTSRSSFPNYRNLCKQSRIGKAWLELFTIGASNSISLSFDNNTQLI